MKCSSKILKDISVTRMLDSGAEGDGSEKIVLSQITTWFRLLPITFQVNYNKPLG